MSKNNRVRTGAVATGAFQHKSTGEIEDGLKTIVAEAINRLHAGIKDEYVK